MVSTRRSANVDSSPKQDKPAAGSKRKEHADDSKSKHEPKAAKRQTTLEETISGNHEQDSHKDIEMKEASEGDGAEEPTQEKQTEEKKAVEEEITDEEMKMAEEKATDEEMKTAEENDAKDAPAKEEEPKGDSNSEANAVQESSQRKENLPSNILEKGIVYFFIRNRVGIDDSESVGDLQRTYFVLRPLPIGAELGDGAIPDANNNRLFALPKKVFPKSANDRFMAFVEKSNTSIQNLKDNFFQGTEYKTQTSGTRQNNPVAPVGEGVYAITRTEDRSTHLAFALTIPTELGEVQTDLGLRAQGSFHISVKNPERPGPASARLPQGPGFPKECVC
jgi:hypothetical protein